MYGLHSLALLLSLPILINAVTTTRVCQSSLTYAPNSVDCKNAVKTIQQTYGANITQAGFYSSCEIIYSFQTCRVNLCAFPGQTLSTSDVVAGVNDILSNCNSPSGGATNTGGYNVIQGTNFTIGVSGTASPRQYKCSVSSASSPLLNDCLNAYSSISDQVNVTQSSSTGCTTVAVNGTCAISYCDKPAAQMNGAELKSYAGTTALTCNSDNAKYGDGFVQIDTDKRVGVYSVKAPTAVLTSSPVCRNYTDGGPASAVCARALQSLPKSYGSTITQNQTNSGCVQIFADGNCQMDLCAPTGSQVTTNQVLNAIKQINSTCSHLPPGGSQQPEMGGYLRIGATNATLVVSTTSVPKNVWCNTSPNNSPLFNDCFAAYNSINTSAIYYQRSVSQGCTLLATNGTCKVNFCSPPGDSITGQQLKNAAGSIILSTCPSGNYVSGIYQINQYTSVGVYDPVDLDTFGDIACTNTVSHPDFSPLESDCNTLAQKWIADPDRFNCNSVRGDPTDYKVCTIIDSQGTCGVAICQNKRNIGCDELGQIVQAMAHRCFTEYKGAFYTSAAIGIRNELYGDHQVFMYNANLQPFGPYKNKDGSNQKRALVDAGRIDASSRRSLIEARAENLRASKTRSNTTLTRRAEGPPDMTELPSNAFQSTQDGFYIQPNTIRFANGVTIDSMDRAIGAGDLDENYDGTQQWVASPLDLDDGIHVVQVQLNAEGEATLDDAGFDGPLARDLADDTFYLRDRIDPRNHQNTIHYPGEMTDPAFFVANVIRRIPGAGELYRVVGVILIYGIFTQGLSGPSS